MKILMLAWRDMKHPKMGGAEIVTDVYLKGLSKLGYKVTLFTARYENSKEQENFNGYEIIRKGKGIGAHFKGLIYAKKNEDYFDIIIDQINTLPFFTPLAIKKEKRVVFFHQLCKNIWFYESKFPVSLIGYLAESSYLKFYKNTRAFVVSESTKKDLIKYCWMNPNNILFLENQINFKPIKKPKEKENYFVFVGRLTKSKRVEDCIKALSQIKNKSTKLYIIGDGYDKYKNYLKKLTNNLDLNKQIIFTGKINNKERNKLIQKATAILVTSVKEGWGLIVTEANANGTVAITYNADGLRDANKTGFITKENNPEELARLMNFFLGDKNLLREKSEDSLRFAREHCDWDNNTWRLEEWITTKNLNKQIYPFVMDKNSHFYPLRAK